MRVLTYVSKIYEPEQNLLTNDRSGLALYVHDIVRYLAPKCEAFVLTNQPNIGAVIKSIHYIEHKKINLLKWNSLYNILAALKCFCTAKGSLGYRLKCAYYRLDLATFKHELARIKPDIVNIHGCNLEIMRQVQLCKDAGIPFVISLHGLIGIDPTVKGAPELKALEGIVLKKADEERWPIVAISSGVRDRAVKHYGLKDASNIHVILNGTEQNIEAPTNPVKLCDDHILSGRKIITCVGGLSKRKNQKQLVSAWALVPEKIRNNYAVIFFGNDLTNGAISTQICQEELQNSMYVYGFAKKEEVNYAYKHAVLNILPSIDEGFGLSIVEAMTFGVPSVIFDDIDAAQDLYDECSIIFPKDRTTHSLADAIEVALSKEWDAELIKKHGKKFSMNNVSDQYMSLYKEVISNS